MSPDPTGPSGQAGLPPLASVGAPMVAVVAGGELVWTDRGFTEAIGLGPGSPERALVDRTAPWAREGLAARLGGAGGATGVGRFGGRRADGLPWVADLTVTPGSDPRSGGEAVVLAGVRVGGQIGWAAAAPPAEVPLGLDSMLSHDVRGALRHAAGFAGVVGRALAGAVDDATLPEALTAAPERLDVATRAVATADEMVEAAVRHLRVLVEPWTVEAVPLEQLVLRAAATARTRLAGAAPDAKVAAGGDIGLVASPGPLVEAVAELVVNAVRFGGPEAHVTVAATRIDHGWVRVAVADDGPGVPPELAEDAFLPGRMLQPRGRFPGVGMGLALVRVIVARHGGRAGIEPRGVGDRGTTVLLELPARSSGGDR